MASKRENKFSKEVVMGKPRKGPYTGTVPYFTGENDPAYQKAMLKAKRGTRKSFAKASAEVDNMYNGDQLKKMQNIQVTPGKWTTK